MEIGAYLTGYADGEGCFCVSFSRSRRHQLGWEIRPSFSVSQNRDRKEVLELFKKYFGCGTIRPDRSDKTLKFKTRSLEDLVSKVIPHFEKYPFISGKEKDFERFKEICQLMSQGAHRSKKEFLKIVDIAYQMNGSGMRKYSKSEMKL